MATANLEKFRINRGGRRNFLVPIVVFWGIVALSVMAYVWVENDLGRSLEGFYLIPWVFLGTICVLGPSAYLLYKGKFDFFHPLTFAAWSYVFPAYVLGGLIITFGLVNPYFLTFVEDPQYNLPLSLVLISVGFLAMSAGFALPVGRSIAARLETLLPKWQWDTSDVWIPGILLLFAGIGVNVFALIQGLMGYQRITEYGMFDSFLIFLLVLLSEGFLLLWIGIFATRKKTGLFYIGLFFGLVIIPLRLALLGGRSSLLQSIIPMAMAFQYSGRRLKMKYAAAFCVLIVLAAGIGVIYGTAFRRIKGTEARIDAGDYVGVIGDTVDYLLTEDPMIIAATSAQSLADRVENLSSIGVLVANYEKLAPYEASYGLDNNILNDAVTAFVPRFAWPDKPPTSDPRAYADLYFNYGENSFTISPFGDLLRNYGFIGVVIGMMLLGIYQRIIYASLIDTPNPAMWKKIAYYPLLTLISYEAFYATIFPSIIRTVFVLVISLVLVNLLIRRLKTIR